MKLLTSIILLVFLYSCFSDEQNQSEKKSPTASLTDQFSEKCFQSINGLPSVIKTFGYDPENMTEAEQKFMAEYDRAYCNCEASNYMKSGKITKSLVELSLKEFNDYLIKSNQTPFGKGVFKLCDQEAIEKAKPYYVKPE